MYKCCELKISSITEGKIEDKPEEDDDDYIVPHQYTYNGVIYTDGLIPKDVVPKIKTYDLKDEDVLVAGYPRSGTTLVEEIVWLILNSSDMHRSESEYLRSRCLFLEAPNSEEELIKRTPPTVMKSHLYWDMLPQVLSSSQCKTKIIHVARNPKDVAVSYFHLYRSLEDLGYFQGSWSKFFRLFLSGKVVAGDWFDYEADWAWKCEQHKDRILLVKYEDLRFDHLKAVRKIAKFLGRTLSASQEEEIIHRTSFSVMQKNKCTNFSMADKLNHEISQFIRKGMVGDWRNYFTDEQYRAFEKRCRQLRHKFPTSVQDLLT